MKARKPVVLGLVATLGLAGAVALANAQTAAPTPPPAAAAPDQGGPGFRGPGMERWMGGEMGMGMGMGRHWGRMSREDRAAFLDARIAGVHAGLRLSAEQEKLWPAVETAVRDMAKTMTEQFEKRQSAGRPKDPIEGMQRMAQMQTLRGETLKKVADAAAPLYASLSAEQKERLPKLAHPGMRERMGMWMRHHGMNWGWGRDDEHGPRWRQGEMMDGPPMGRGMGPRGDWR
jgi:zinc resistance-associated protein